MLKVDLFSNCCACSWQLQRSILDLIQADCNRFVFSHGGACMCDLLQSKSLLQEEKLTLYSRLINIY